MPITANILDAARPLEHILATEGEWRTLYGHSSLTVPVANTSASNTILQSESAFRPDGSATFGLPYVGRCMWVEWISVSASQDGIYQLTSNTGQSVVNGTTKYSPWLWRGHLKANTPIIIPVRQFWKHDRFENANGAIPTISLQSRQFTPALAVDTSVSGAVTIGGYVVTDDLNFYASKTLLVVGDSLSYLDGDNSPTDASGYPSSAEYCWTHIVRDGLVPSAGDIRLASVAQPGLTTGHVRLQAARGRFDPIRCAAGLYVLGTNDVVGAAGNLVDTYEANLRHWINRWTARRPYTPLFIIPPGPIYDDTQEANAALVRARAATVVASIGASNVRVVDLGSAFARKTVSFYRNGLDLLHWSNAGNAAVASTVLSGISASGLSI